MTSVATKGALLSVVDLPKPVMDLFCANMKVVQGTLEDAAALKPHAILCSIGSPRLDSATISRLPDSVKAIATYSVGHDHIDLAAAKDRGIAVFNTPGVLGDAVADAAMLLILGAVRRATEGIALIREGRWTGWTPQQLIGLGLSGRTLGIFGMGGIGQRIATRARGFGMSVAYHNRRPVAGHDAIFFDDPRALLGVSDIILLAWPSSPATRGFISAGTLALAKSEAVLINIGRGDLVDDIALINALKEGRIFAAGLDVFDGEPDIHPGYLDLPNAFILPHIGSSTWDARLAMGQLLVDALTAHAGGSSPANQIA